MRQIIQIKHKETTRSDRSRRLNNTLLLDFSQDVSGEGQAPIVKAYFRLILVDGLVL